MFSAKKLSCIDHLNSSLLEELQNNEIGAVIIKGVYSKEICLHLSEQIKQKMKRGTYANAPLIDRVGKAFFETLSSENLYEEYFKLSLAMTAELREVFFPYLSPIDLLRLKLDEIYVQGCNLATLNRKKMFAGLVRFFKEGSTAEPHQDIIKRDAKGFDLGTHVTGQLAFNLYLQEAQEGGELHIWNWRPSLAEAKQYQHTDPKLSYGLNLRQTPKENPDLRIQVEAGDFIFFNSRNVHAVSTIGSGERISVSSFIGYRGAAQSLQLWS